MSLDDNRDMQWIFHVLIGWLALVVAAIPVLVLSGSGFSYWPAAPWVLLMGWVAARSWICAYVIVTG